MHTVGERIRAYRKAHRLTQQGLAALLGVNQCEISRIENNVRSLSVQRLLQIAAALRIEPGSLLNP